MWWGMDVAATGFIHPSHLGYFVEAAQVFNAYILVRKTGFASLQWVGKNGYTAKRADLKAKTASRDVGMYRLSGLVCSPFLQPLAFEGERLSSAQKYWPQSTHLISVPDGSRGGLDDAAVPRCITPYILQTNRNHVHYGCVAWVESGLLLPRYIHGDYDLYAVVPADHPASKVVHRGSQISPMSPTSASLARRLELSSPVPDFTGPLLFRISNWLNLKIGQNMVMHGEQENVNHQDEPLLAVLPKSHQGSFLKVLANEHDRDAFYRTELQGRR